MPAAAGTVPTHLPAPPLLLAGGAAYQKFSDESLRLRRNLSSAELQYSYVAQPIILISPETGIF